MEGMDKKKDLKEKLSLLFGRSRSMNSEKIPTFIEGKLGYYSLAGETSISNGSIEAAYEAVRVAISAVDTLVKDKLSGIFALCRPPGHHASKNQYGGYCFFNNAAIAAERFKELGAKKIFILDIDFHHGNGTQSIFYDKSDVFYASLHGDPMFAFPHFLGHSDERGSGNGEGYNSNFPMPPGTNFQIWLEAFDNSIKEIKKFKPDALVISLGVDAYEKDPISFFKLKSNNFIDIGRKLSKLSIPTLFVMEGGYSIKEIGVNTVNTLEGFENG
jgi:Deacetylases, including yeast histone deacetylase and acetoin utilization protein